MKRGEPTWLIDLGRGWGGWTCCIVHASIFRLSQRVLSMLTKRAFLYGCVGCACGLGGAVALAREGVEVKREASVFAGLVPAAEVEQSARKQYGDMMKDAASKNALGPDHHPEVMRLRRIAKDLIPHSLEWNPRAKEWKWEVNLVGSLKSLSSIVSLV